jgi:ABC-type methionine transport system ATPase subunit
MIQIDNVSKVYGRNAAVHALKQLSLTIPAGEALLKQRPSC